MPYTLEVTTDFLKSDDQPAVSVFSGATEDVVERRFSVNRFTPWWVLCAVAGALPGILVLAAAARNSHSVRPPQVHGEATAWYWKMHGWFVPAYVMSGFVWICLVNADEFGFTPFFVSLVVFALALIPAIFGSIWYRANLVQFSPGDRRRVTITFPDRMAETYEIFKEAYRRHQEFEEPGTRRRRNGGGEDEEWSDEVNAGWDEKRPKS